MSLRRRTRMPDEVRARLELPKGDSVLAEAPVPGGWVVASTHHLTLLRDEVPLVRAWHLVDAARLETEGDVAVLTITWVDGMRATELPLGEEARRLTRAVHDRVQSSVVHRETLRLPSGTSVRVVLRRDEHGDLLSQVIGTGDVDLADPVTAELVEAAEVRVREAVGLR